MTPRKLRKWRQRVSNHLESSFLWAMAHSSLSHSSELIYAPSRAVSNGLGCVYHGSTQWRTVGTQGHPHTQPSPAMGCASVGYCRNTNCDFFGGGAPRVGHCRVMNSAQSWAESWAPAPAQGWCSPVSTAGWVLGPGNKVRAWPQLMDLSLSSLPCCDLLWSGPDTWEGSLQSSALTLP